MNRNLRLVYLTLGSVVQSYTRSGAQKQRENWYFQYRQGRAASRYRKNSEKKSLPNMGSQTRVKTMKMQRRVGPIAERENTLLYLAVVSIISNFQTDSSKPARVSNGREKKQESKSSTITSKNKGLQGQIFPSLSQIALRHAWHNPTVRPDDRALQTSTVPLLISSIVVCIPLNEPIDFCSYFS